MFLEQQISILEWFLKIMWHWRLEEWCWKYSFDHRNKFHFNRYGRNVLFKLFHNIIFLLYIFNQTNAALKNTRNIFQKALKKVCTFEKSMMIQKVDLNAVRHFLSFISSSLQFMVHLSKHLLAIFTSYWFCLNLFVFSSTCLQCSVLWRVSLFSVNPVNYTMHCKLLYFSSKGAKEAWELDYSLSRWN